MYELFIQLQRRPTSPVARRSSRNDDPIGVPIFTFAGAPQNQGTSGYFLTREFLIFALGSTEFLASSDVSTGFKPFRSRPRGPHRVAPRGATSLRWESEDRSVLMRTPHRAYFATRQRLAGIGLNVNRRQKLTPPASAKSTGSVPIGIQTSRYL